MKRYDIYASTHHTTSWGEPCVVADLHVTERPEGEWVKHSELPVIILPMLNPEMFNEDVLFGFEKARNVAKAKLEAMGFKVSA